MDWKNKQGSEWYKHIANFENLLSQEQSEDFKFGEGMQLFFNCVVAKEKMKPDYFIFENVNSMDKGIKEFIQVILQCDVTETNANLVSAQNRKRVIFHNLGIIPEAEDKGILLKDILESGIVDKEKAYCLKHQAGNARDYLKKHHTQVSFEPVCIAQRGRYLKEDGGVLQHFEPREDGKTNTLTTVSKDNLVADPVYLRYVRNEEGKRLRKQYKQGELGHGFNEHRVMEPRSDGKSNTISTVTKDNIIAEPVRIGTIDSDSQAHRVYSPYAKSVTLISNGGGQGAKTGLYATPVNINNCKCLSPAEMEYMLRETKGGRNHFDYGYIHCTTNDKSQCVLANLHKGVPYNVCCQQLNHEFCIDLNDYENVIYHDSGNIEVDGKLIYCVKDGKIPYKDKLYDIKLPDGYYIIRKLTPLECERLQTLPMWEIETEVEIYLDQAKSFVNVVEKNPKLLKLVLSAENKALQECANHAIKNIQQNHQQTKYTVQKNVDIKINSWQLNLMSLKEKDVNLPVDNVGQNVLFQYQKTEEDFAQLNVLENSIVEQTLSSGKAELHQKDSKCIKAKNGKMLLRLSGREIMQLANDVEKFLTTQKNNNFIYTTLSRLNISNLEQILTILYWFAKTAIDTFIVKEMKILNISFLHNIPYTNGVSDSQRYRMIGNGWCKDDIKRFFAVALANTDTNEQIICQSFYDGIATARLILDDLGFNNIKYTAYEVDKYAMKVATSNYPDINEAGDAFGVREDTWQC